MFRDLLPTAPVNLLIFTIMILFLNVARKKMATLYYNKNFNKTLILSIASYVEGDNDEVFLYFNNVLLTKAKPTCHYYKFDNISRSGSYHAIWKTFEAEYVSNYLEVSANVSQSSQYYYPKVTFTKADIINYIDSDIKDYRLEVRFKCQDDKRLFHSKYPQYALIKVFKTKNAYIQRAFGMYYFIEESLKWGHDELKYVAREFNNCEFVQYALLYALNKPPLTSSKIAGPQGSTPNFELQQRYLDGGDQMGMNVREAWQLGIRGRRATIRFLEWGLFELHEDLIGNITVARTNLDRNPNHGTATAGLLVAKDNGFGVTGICNQARAFYYDHLQLDDIIEDCSPGDIIGIYKQLNVWPADRDEATYLRMRILSQELECVVLMLIGNHHSDIRWNGGRQNYGQTTVAGCHPETGLRFQTNFWSLPQSTNNPLDGSNSVLNSWSTNVTTTGYGDLFFPNGDPNRSYTSQYSGSSSATPLVSGVFALVQSALMQRFTYMDGQTLRDVVRFTGYTEGVPGGIGFRPNAERAIQAALKA